MNIPNTYSEILTYFSAETWRELTNIILLENTFE